MDRLINRRQQGDLGETSAIDWFTRQGATVSAPLGHSPDYDLIAGLGERLYRVQVKTTTQSSTASDGAPRFHVMMATNGGNQSWSGRIKRFDSSRFDLLFALVGCGRRWLLPADRIEAKNTLNLGGRKYSEFEIEPTAPIDELVYGAQARGLESRRRGGVSKRSKDGGCKPSGFAFEGSNPSSSTAGPAFAPVAFERGPGRLGQAIISRKRLLTIPVAPAKAAGLAAGDRLRVEAAGPGRLTLERIEEATAIVAPSLFSGGQECRG